MKNSTLVPIGVEEDWLANQLQITLTLRYEPEEDRDGWFVEVKEMPGCMSQGATFSEAMAMIQDAMVGWIDCTMVDRPLTKSEMQKVIRCSRAANERLGTRQNEKGD